MFRQTTASNKPPEKQCWAVFDESEAGSTAIDLGRHLRNFPTQRQAQLFRSRLAEVARLIKNGLGVRYAFPPNVDVQTLIHLVNANPGVRPRVARLREALSVGELVQRQHLYPAKQDGFLRCH